MQETAGSIEQVRGSQGQGEARGVQGDRGAASDVVVVVKSGSQSTVRDGGKSDARERKEDTAAEGKDD